MSWVAAVLALLVLVSGIVAMLPTARRTFHELVASVAMQDQTSGDDSTNYQAGGDVIVSAGIPEGTPSAERGQFWLGLGGHSKTVETTSEREARERADYVLLQARLRHPAGKARPRDN